MRAAVREVRGRAAVLERSASLVVRDAPVLVPLGSSLIRVEQAGVCGTDRKIIEGAVPVSVPRIIGHEIVGTVVETGEPLESNFGVARFLPGDRVLVNPSVSCGTCIVCRRGWSHLCPGGGLIGRDVDGGLAEVVAVPPFRLHKVPADVDSDEAAILQVLGTCVHAQHEVNVFPGQTAVVIGLGVAGLLHLQLLRVRGATVVGVARSPEKRALGKTLGATLVTSPREAPSVVEELTGGHGADVVIEAVGDQRTVAAGVAMAAPRATIVVFGTISGKGKSIPYYDLYLKELRLVSPRAALPSDYDEAIALAAGTTMSAHSMVTSRFPLEMAPDVFARWGADPARLKVVFEP